LDLASWDSYPLGFLEQFWFTDKEKGQFARQGHPDVAAYHHDLYRGMCRGQNERRWGVMEQQPGPVNWAKWNPAPLPGMVRLWSWEAAAHGAEFCSYFRWRQVPFAQEQMHAGLLRPDNKPAPGYAEARQIGRELRDIDLGEHGKSDTALIFSYDADWMIRTQPQGADFRYDELTFRWYSALRQLGLDVDIVSPDADLRSYKLVVDPTLPHLGDAMQRRFEQLDAIILFGPRTGSKTENLSIAEPHGLEFMDLRVDRVESLRPGLMISTKDNQNIVERWMEEASNGAEPVQEMGDGRALLLRRDNCFYCAGWPGENMLLALMRDMAGMAGLAVHDLPTGLRIKKWGSNMFAFNYGAASVNLTTVFPELAGDVPLLGTYDIPPAGVTIWKA